MEKLPEIGKPLYIDFIGKSVFDLNVNGEDVLPFDSKSSSNEVSENELKNDVNRPLLSSKNNELKDYVFYHNKIRLDNVKVGRNVVTVNI